MQTRSRPSRTNLGSFPSHLSTTVVNVQPKSLPQT
uniref:Uncharacterized protein n=1 Tax=Rhizophora mucronata TaxID=61149 RepID=A0A2P2NU39_RHIMU